MEWFVSASAPAGGDGSHQYPFQTITEASYKALPGDTVTVSPGVYREHVNPIRGGRAEAPICYRSEIKGAAIVSGCEVVNCFYPRDGAFFCEIGEPALYGDVQGVYANGNPLIALSDMETFRSCVNGRYPIEISPKVQGVYVTEALPEKTVLHVFMEDKEPDACLMEILFRPYSFFSTREHIDAITVSGFVLRGCAGCASGSGWVVEDCEVLDAPSHGILFDGKSSGGHIVRRCHIHHCGRSGIRVRNSMGDGRFLQNHIHHTPCGFFAEGLSDTVFYQNRTDHCVTGLTLSAGAQGVTISKNLFHDNGKAGAAGGDLSFEGLHGPVTVTHNLLMSDVCATFLAEGYLFANNLIAGFFKIRRDTEHLAPFFRRHTTQRAGEMPIAGGDGVVVRNIFLSGGCQVFDMDTPPFPGSKEPYPVRTTGNVYFGNARPALFEQDPIVPGIRRITCLLTEGEQGDVLLETDLYDHVPKRLQAFQVYGPDMRARIPDQPYADIRNKPMLRSDYMGMSDPSGVYAGPFLQPQDQMKVFDGTLTKEAELQEASDETMKAFRMESLSCAYAILNTTSAREIFLKGNIAWVRFEDKEGLKEMDCAYGISKTLDRWSMEADETLEASELAACDLIAEAVVLLCKSLESSGSMPQKRREALLAESAGLLSPYGISMRLTERYLKFVGEGERRFLTLEEVVRTLRHKLVNQVAEVIVE